MANNRFAAFKQWKKKKEKKENMFCGFFDSKKLSMFINNIE